MALPARARARRMCGKGRRAVRSQHSGLVAVRNTSCLHSATVTVRCPQVVTWPLFGDLPKQRERRFPSPGRQGRLRESALRGAGKGGGETQTWSYLLLGNRKADMKGMSPFSPFSDLLKKSSKSHCSHWAPEFPEPRLECSGSLRLTRTGSPRWESTGRGETSPQIKYVLQVDETHTQTNEQTNSVPFPAFQCVA